MRGPLVEEEGIQLLIMLRLCSGQPRIAALFILDPNRSEMLREIFPRRRCQRARPGGLAARPALCRRVAYVGQISGRGQNVQEWEERHECVVDDVWVARGRRTNGGLAVRVRALAAAAEEWDAPVATGVMPT